MADPLQPDIDAVNKPYWDGLAQGHLLFQECRCGHRWLPARAACPACLQKQWQWQKSAGRGCIKSWVVYHQAYHPAFKDRLPYNVALVQLDEGPRLLTNIICPNECLNADDRVTLCIDTSSGIALALFEIAQ